MSHTLITHSHLSHCPLVALCSHVIADISTADAHSGNGFYWLHVNSTNWLEQLEGCVAMGHTAIVVAPQLELNELQRALQAGARGYCQDSCSLIELGRIIRAVEQGGIWVPGGMLGSLVSLLSQHPTFQRFSETSLRLTDREKQVVNEVLAGASNLTIAHHLSITVSTVKDHMASIFRKLEVKDRVQLLLKLGQFQKLKF